jgi:hypothetical protein
MKNYSKPSPSKLLARFDQELKNLLMEDLKAFRTKNQNIRKVGLQPQHLHAA